MSIKRNNTMEDDINIYMSKLNNETEEQHQEKHYQFDQILQLQNKQMLDLEREQKKQQEKLKIKQQEQTKNLKKMLNLNIPFKEKQKILNEQKNNLLKRAKYRQEILDDQPPIEMALKMVLYFQHQHHQDTYNLLLYQHNQIQRAKTRKEQAHLFLEHQQMFLKLFDIQQKVLLQTLIEQQEKAELECSAFRHLSLNDDKEEDERTVINEGKVNDNNEIDLPIPQEKYYEALKEPIPDPPYQIPIPSFMKKHNNNNNVNPSNSNKYHDSKEFNHSRPIGQGPSTSNSSSTSSSLFTCNNNVIDNQQPDNKGTNDSSWKSCLHDVLKNHKDIRNLDDHKRKEKEFMERSKMILQCKNVKEIKIDGPVPKINNEMNPKTKKIIDDFFYKAYQKYRKSKFITRLREEMVNDGIVPDSNEVFHTKFDDDNDDDINDPNIPIPTTKSKILEEELKNNKNKNKNKIVNSNPSMEEVMKISPALSPYLQSVVEPKILPNDPNEMSMSIDSTMTPGKEINENNNNPKDNTIKINKASPLPLNNSTVDLDTSMDDVKNEQMNTPMKIRDNSLTTMAPFKTFNLNTNNVLKPTIFTNNNNNNNNNKESSQDKKSISTIDTISDTKMDIDLNLQKKHSINDQTILTLPTLLQPTKSKMINAPSSNTTVTSSNITTNLPDINLTSSLSDTIKKPKLSPSEIKIDYNDHNEVKSRPRTNSESSTKSKFRSKLKSKSKKNTSVTKEKSMDEQAKENDNKDKVITEDKKEKEKEGKLSTSSPTLLKNNLSKKDDHDNDNDNGDDEEQEKSKETNDDSSSTTNSKDNKKKKDKYENVDTMIVDGELIKIKEFVVEDEEVDASGVKRKHQRVVRRFYCIKEGCNKSFTTSGHVTRHIRTCHLALRPFHCKYPGCKSKFGRQDNLRQHYKVHYRKEPNIKFNYREVLTQKQIKQLNISPEIMNVDNDEINRLYDEKMAKINGNTEKNDNDNDHNNGKSKRNSRIGKNKNNNKNKSDTLNNMNMNKNDNKKSLNDKIKDKKETIKDKRKGKEIVKENVKKNEIENKNKSENDIIKNTTISNTSMNKVDPTEKEIKKEKDMNENEHDIIFEKLINDIFPNDDDHVNSFEKILIEFDEKRKNESKNSLNIFDNDLDNKGKNEEDNNNSKIDKEKEEMKKKMSMTSGLNLFDNKNNISLMEHELSLDNKEKENKENDGKRKELEKEKEKLVKEEELEKELKKENEENKVMDWKIDDSNITLEPIDLMSVTTSISDSMPLYSTTLPENLYSNSLPMTSYTYHETNANPETIISEINTTTKIPSSKINLIKEAQMANKDINAQVKNIPINSIQEKDIQSIAFNNSNRPRANSNSTVLLNSTPHVTVAANKNRKPRSLSLDSKKSPVINNPGLHIITSLSSPFAPSSEFDASNLISPRLFTNLTVDGIQPIVINNININSNNNSNILSATSLTQNNITQNAIPHNSLTQNPTVGYSVSSLNKNIPLETTTSVNSNFSYGIDRSNSLPNTNSHRTPILHSTQTLNTSPTNSLLLSCPNPNPNPNPNPIQIQNQIQIQTLTQNLTQTQIQIQIQIQIQTQTQNQNQIHLFPLIHPQL